MSSTHGARNPEDAATRLRGAAAKLEALVASPPALASANRMAAAATVFDLASRSSSLTTTAAASALEHLHYRSLRVAEYAQVLARRTVTELSSSDWGQLEEVTEGLLEDAAKVQQLLEIVGHSQALPGTASGLAPIVREYGRDADRERLASRGFLGVALITAALATGTLAWGLARLGASPSTTRLRVFAAHLSVALVLGVATFVILNVGEKRSRRAAEHQKQQRQLSALDAYLAPLPTSTAHLLRAVLVPRLFPRSIEDDDPLRDPVWPTPGDLQQLLESSSRAHPPEGGGGGTGGIL